jgi:tRNA 2-thiouridine synthesizing protein A
MGEFQLDITGKICPFCLLLVKKKLATLGLGDVLTVKCDHPPAATDTIPYAMEKAGYPTQSRLLEPGVWELRIKKAS